MEIKSILGITNPRFLNSDGTQIDMIVKADSGDLPFLYVKGDTAPLAKLVEAYLAGKPGLKIAPYQAPKALAKETKGGDND